MSPEPERIVIALATYNGEAYIEQQLDSIEQQRCELPIDIRVLDDGSSDSTLDKVRTFAATYSRGQVQVHRHHRYGFAKNFLSAFDLGLPATTWLAYADQDDVWLPCKLERSVTALKPYANTPALYCSRTRLIDAQGQVLGLSRLYRDDQDILDALVQNIASGNTVLLNPAAVRKLTLAKRLLTRVPEYHDWWSYTVVLAVGGEVVYDPEPTVDYRQHSDNVIGNNAGLRSLKARLERYREGQLGLALELRLRTLNDCHSLMTPYAQQRMADFTRLRAKETGLLERIRLVKSLAIRKISPIMTALLTLLFLLKRY